MSVASHAPSSTVLEGIGGRWDPALGGELSSLGLGASIPVRKVTFKLVFLSPLDFLLTTRSFLAVFGSSSRFRLDPLTEAIDDGAGEGARTSSYAPEV